MSSIQELQACGQSIWLDLISRGLITSGELKRLIDRGVTGVTSNPSIFQKSICETHDYDEAINAIIHTKPDIEVTTLYEKLVIQDIQMSADALRPIYNNTRASDGFVSLEVSPHLANSSEGTISEAQRLWKLVDRPNLLVKIPATLEGFPAIETLISQGININATLIFSLTQYQEVAKAYIRGLEMNTQPQNVTSVASFFISRIDTLVDKALENTHHQETLKLRGKTAIACAKVVYQSFREIFYGTPFAQLRKRGCKPQKLVWGSTGTKNPVYSDVIYVEEIIGENTINTVPLSTLQAFLDHGKARPSLIENIEISMKLLSNLPGFGIDLNVITKILLEDGVQSFLKAYDQLIDSLRGRCPIR